MFSGLSPLPVRPTSGHKGTFGTVLVIGGCDSGKEGGPVMVGAPAMASRAALRIGAGLVKVAAPGSICTSLLTMCPSATAIGLPQDDRTGEILPSPTAALLDEILGPIDTIAIGPGWGVGLAQQQILIRLLAGEERPIIIDADGLNNLAALEDFSSDIRGPVILTPHPGEFERLAHALGWTSDLATPSSDEQRQEAAVRLAQRLGCIVVLKGARTVVTDGHRSWTCDSSNAALATAGTGDVLTGVIAGVTSQFFKPQRGNVTPSQQSGLDLMSCAQWGVALHAVAGELWRQQHGDAGLLADDLIDLLPAARQLSSEQSEAAGAI